MMQICFDWNGSIVFMILTYYYHCYYFSFSDPIVANLQGQEDEAEAAQPNTQKSIISVLLRYLDRFEQQ